MHVEYIARFALPILGRQYAPGEVINDPAIQPSTLAALENARRIEKRIARDKGLVDPITTHGTLGLPPEEFGDPWKLAWARDHNGLTFAQFLEERLKGLGLSPRGNTQERLDRLQEAGVTP